MSDEVSASGGWFQNAAPAGSGERAPERIGGYRVLRLIGAGGMGRVYEAEQAHPRRRVALKVLQPGLLSRAALRRFEYESEWLARLDHPGIARVYDAGAAVADDGARTPYFAMELVDGQRLDRWAGAQGAPLDRERQRARVRLLAEVSDAVHHAHQKGLIHRDLKPANILVTASGEPKILDFGVARAFGDDAAALETLHTAHGALVGTARYMSPEQATGDATGLDTRSDVYALGVIAYELLTGRMPYDLEGKSITGVIDVIRTVEPAPLSRDDPRVRGDLETIVGRALEKRKEARYASAAVMAWDLQAYLEDRPIQARARGWAYHAAKFARGNRLLVGSAAAVAATLLIGIVATTSAMIRADRARAAEADHLRRAESAAAVARQTNGFLNDLLGGADPFTSRGQNFTVRQLLDASADRLPAQFPAQPTVEASLQVTVGNAYRNLGLPEQAIPHLRRAVELLAESSGGEPGETRPDDRDDLRGRAREAYAQALQAAGKPGEAEQAFRELLQGFAASYGPRDRRTLGVRHNLAGALYEQGRLDDAEAVFRQTIADREAALGPDDLDTLMSRHGLSLVLQAMGRVEQAESIDQDLYDRAIRTLGDDHPLTIVTLGSLGQARLQRGDFAAAEPLLRDHLHRARRVFGDTSDRIAPAEHNLASLLMQTDRLTEAEALLRPALDWSRRLRGDDHPSTVAQLNALAVVTFRLGRLDEAEALQHEVVERARRTLGDDHLTTIQAINNFGGILAATGRPREAESCYREAIERSTRLVGVGYAGTLAALDALGMMLFAERRFHEAVPVYQQAHAGVQTAVLPPAHAAYYVAKYGRALLRTDRADEAEPILKEALARLESAPGSAGDPWFGVIYDGLTTACEQLGRWAEAVEWRARAEATRRPATAPARE